MVDPQARMPLGAGCRMRRQGVLARRPLEPLLRSAGPPAGFPHQGDPDGGMAGDGGEGHRYCALGPQRHNREQDMHGSAGEVAEDVDWSICRDSEVSLCKEDPLPLWEP